MIEGVGDHGCEYMTGGRVVVLGLDGPQLRRRACSGGVAYVWAPDRERFLLNLNMGMVEAEPVEAEEDVEELKQLIELHQNFTGSPRAGDILDRWDETLPQFVKVMPEDYNACCWKRKRPPNKSTRAPAAV